MARSKAEKQAEMTRAANSVRWNQWKGKFIEHVVRLATVPILSSPSPDKPPELIATGVLNKMGGHVFIFTALHALEQLQGRSIVVPVMNGRLIEIEGRGLGSSKYDAGVFHIENQDLQPFQEIALPGGVVFAQTDVLIDRLAIFGYRAGTVKRKGATYSCLPSQYQLRGKPENVYQRLSRSSDDYILLNWRKKLIGPKGVVRSPSLAGMSGSGVWFSPVVTSRPLSIHVQDELPRLVGIFVEQRRNQSMLVATNVRHHVHIVFSAYPEILERARPAYIDRLVEMKKLEERLGMTGRDRSGDADYQTKSTSAS